MLSSCHTICIYIAVEVVALCYHTMPYVLISYPSTDFFPSCSKGTICMQFVSFCGVLISTPFNKKYAWNSAKKKKKKPLHGALRKPQWHRVEEEGAGIVAASRRIVMHYPLSATYCCLSPPSCATNFNDVSVFSSPFFHIFSFLFMTLFFILSHTSSGVPFFRRLIQSGDTCNVHHNTYW